MTSTASSPPIVLIHGVGLSADAWRDMVPMLSEHHAVTCIELPGHGNSPSLDNEVDATLRDYTERLAGIIEGMDGPVVIVGHSMGALIAMDLAITRPDLVAAAVPLNAVYRRSAEAAAAVRSRAASLARGEGSDPTLTLQRWFGKAPKGPLLEARDRCHAMLESVDRSAYAAAYRIFAREDGPEDSALRACPVPMLFITGSEEPNSTPAMSRALADAAPNGRCAILDGARHMMPMTHVQDVAEEILAFARKLG